MNPRVLALCGLATVLGLGATFGVSAQPPASPSAPPAGRMGRMGREKHPELRAALRALQNAKSRLQKSDRDFDGHRAKAAEHTEEAIREVELAIASDKR